MKSDSEEPRTNKRLWVRTASVETQAISNRGKFPKGSLLSAPAIMTSSNGPFFRLYWCWFPGLVRGRLHSAIVRAMKPSSGSASLAPINWFT